MSGAERRLGVAGVASIGAHAALVALALAITAPLDSGFEFTAPIEVELGLTDATEVAAAPVTDAPPVEPEAAGSAGAAAGAGLDGGVPFDASGGDASIGDGGAPDAARRRRRDAGVDGGEPGVDGGQPGTAGGDGGMPVAFLPAGAQIAMRIDMDRIRASPLRTEVEHLLSAIPDWNAVLGGSGIDPVRDLSRVLVATPNFQRANIVVAGAMSEGAPAPREVAERVAAASGHTLAWSETDGIETAPFYSPDGADRSVAILDARHVVLSRPQDLERVLAIAAARATDGASPADALLSMGDAEAVSVEVEGLSAFVRRSPCEVARRARVAMRETSTGVRIEGDAIFTSEEQASSARACFDNLRIGYAQNLTVQFLGFSPPLYEIELEVEGPVLHVRGGLTFDQLRRILSLLTDLLRPPPPPPAPVAPPPPSTSTSTSTPP